MRTDEDILNRINAVKNSDFFGFQKNNLLLRLPFELAKEFLVDTAKKEDWTILPRDRESLLKEMKKHMPFAWYKANNTRAISVERSMSHYTAWIWLAGDDLGNLTDYNYYGKDNLVKICKFYGWDSSEWDDGKRYN